MNSSKGLSRRGFLGVMKATAAAATVNPTIVAQQTLPEIAKAMTSTFVYPYRTQTLFSSMFIKIQFHKRVMNGEEGPYQEVIKDNIDFAREKKWSNLHDASSSMFYYDMACTLSDKELTQLYAHKHATYKNGIENLSHCGELQDELDLLGSMKSPDDIRHELRQYRDFQFSIFREGVKVKPSSHPIAHLKKMGASPSILLKANFLSLEDQLRLYTYVDSARTYIPLCRSLKGGLISIVFEEMKETEAFNYLRYQALNYVTSKENIIKETCPEFISDFIIGKPFTLREIDYIHKERQKRVAKGLWNKDENEMIARVLQFYGADKTPLSIEGLSIKIEEENRGLCSDKKTFIFRVLMDGVTEANSFPQYDDATDNLHQLRQSIFQILGYKIVNYDVAVTEVKNESTSIRVTVPANTEISDFIDMWMAEQNPYDAFWDQEVHNEFLFDVDGYIKRSMLPPQKYTRRGQKPETP